MKKTFVLSLIFLFLFNTFGGMFMSIRAEESKNFDYLINSDPNNASVTFGREIKEINCTFMDGMKLGITDSEDPLYNEHKEVDGLDSRYFLNKNYPYIKINEDFYDPEDRHYLVSIAFYDFGPNRGTFHFEYYDQSNTKKRITMVKTGAVQDWFVKTLYITDMDLSKTFENGANVRLVNGAFNAFKKVEIVNLSKAYREGRSTSISALTSAKMLNWQQLGIINKETIEYGESNLEKPCTTEAAATLFNQIAGIEYKNSDEKITCKNLIATCMDVLGLKKDETNLCKQALDLRLTQEADLFINDDAEATNYHLLSIIYNLMYYNDNRISIAGQMIADGVFDGIDTTTIEDANFISAYYAVPRKCPYKIITDNETGMTMKFINIFGFETVRPYVSQQCWTSDGKSFVVALTSGQMFMYNTETQMLQYVDDVVTDSIVVNGSISLDDKLYYVKNNGSVAELWCYDIKANRKEFIIDGGVDSSFYFPHI